MSSWNALRALTRVELRQLRKNPGRSLLVILLIAVPVAAMVGGSALLFMTRQTIEEQRDEAMGRATLRVYAGGRAGIENALEALPEHARVEHVLAGQVDVGVPGRLLGARYFGFEEGALGAEGLSVGLLHLVEGRAPLPTRLASDDAGEAVREVALSRVLLEGLSVEVGAEVSLADGPARVTGEVADPERLDLPVVLQSVPPFGSIGDGIRGPQGGAQVGRSLLIDLPEAEAASFASSWEHPGAKAVLRAETGTLDSFESFLTILFGSFAFFEAALVVAAAFAVSVRRRQREIGLLGSSGASGVRMGAALLASAACLALIGGLLGVAVGAGSARALHPYLDGWTGRMVGEFELWRVHVFSALGLGIVTAVLAAAVPARSAVRLPIRVALSGRRPVTGSSRAWLVAGAVLAALGVGFVLFGDRLPHALGRYLDLRGFCSARTRTGGGESLDARAAGRDRRAVADLVALGGARRGPFPGAQRSGRHGRHGGYVDQRAVLRVAGQRQQPARSFRAVLARRHVVGRGAGRRTSSASAPGRVGTGSLPHLCRPPTRTVPWFACAFLMPRVAKKTKNRSRPGWPAATRSSWPCSMRARRVPTFTRAGWLPFCPSRLELRPGCMGEADVSWHRSRSRRTFRPSACASRAQSWA